MSEFTALLDAPAAPASRVQIARIGKVVHDTYGEFEITPEDVASWQANLAHLPGQRALIDVDHAADRKPRRTEAYGWLSDVRLEADGRVTAAADWTDLGRKAVKRQRFLFLSPVYGDYKTEDGTEHENTLMGASLTNRPALTAQPPIQLAAPERIELAETAIKLLDTGEADRDEDWKAQRKAVKERARQLDIDPVALGFPKKKRKKKLDQAGGRVRELEAALADRDRQLDAQAFDRAFGEALRERRVTPGQEDPLRRMYALDAGSVLDLMDRSQPILPDGPIGEPAIDWTDEQGPDPDVELRAGIAPGSIELDQRVTERLRKLGRPVSDYAAVLAEMTTEGQR